MRRECAQGTDHGDAGAHAVIMFRDCAASCCALGHCRGAGSACGPAPRRRVRRGPHSPGDVDLGPVCSPRYLAYLRPLQRHRRQRGQRRRATSPSPAPPRPTAPRRTYGPARELRRSGRILADLRRFEFAIAAYTSTSTIVTPATADPPAPARQTTGETTTAGRDILTRSRLRHPDDHVRTATTAAAPARPPSRLGAWACYELPVVAR